MVLLKMTSEYFLQILKSISSSLLLIHELIFRLLLKISVWKRHNWTISIF